MTHTKHVNPDPLPPGQSWCPKCGDLMGLTRVQPDLPGNDFRTFECPRCQHIETMVVAFAGRLSA